jgi:asparagine synthetase B (glutamine-hydrolysing)
VLANDRFTSWPVYYAADPARNLFVASPYFGDLWHFMTQEGLGRIHAESVFEFLWFQRVLGTKTHLENVSFLSDASILEWDGEHCGIQSYWRRAYAKSRLSLRAHAVQLAEQMRRSVRCKTGDGKRYGHFLSGGMDSRSVLCAFPDDSSVLPTCFTATVSENRELRTAAAIAEVRGARHVGLRLDPEHYGRILDHSVRVVGGMYNYDNGLFYGFEDLVRRYADVCFHGHGFDYMFQGMYIPGRSVVVGGRTLYLRFPLDLPDDLVSWFITNASYRTKRADVLRYVRPERRGHFQDFLRHSVGEVLARGRTMTENPYDLVEYLTFHHISRHYSYPNHASIATFAEQRTVSFFNDLFDLYLSLPIEHRFNGTIEKAALRILNPRIASIRSANTNLPVTASHWTQTLCQLASACRNRIFGTEAKPEWQERTWPGRDDAVRQQDSLKAALAGIFASGVLDQLDFLDTGLMADEFTRWVGGEALPGPSGDFVQAVLSVGTFLRQSPEFP